jgi:radical SAM superfamily enzyme YgiQ (UPF0313 family)
MARRLLLINPAHIVDGQRRKGPSQAPIPPLNLGYVAALTPPDWTVHIVDENIHMGKGTDWAPDLVGITALTPTAPRAYSLAAQYRSRGIPVVLGGVHPSTLPEEAARYADSVVIGDAEPIWPQLIGDLEAGQLQRTYRGDFLPLDGLPIPRRDLYPRGYFAETLITSKGCPNACDFCSVWRFYGRRYRTRPIEEVVNELERLSAFKIVFFADDNMTLDHRRTIALCRRIVERGIRRRYAIQATLGLADDAELLHWLKRSGCQFVFVGLESLNTEPLARIGKPDLLRVGVEGYRERIARIHAHGMGVFGSFIVGLDGDTAATFDQIRRFSLASRIDCTLVNILCPTPGTVLWERLCEEGRLLYTDFPADYALYTQDNVCFRPQGMTMTELQEGTRWLIASLTRLPVALRRARTTWLFTRNALATLTAFGWNRRTYGALRTFPLRDVQTDGRPITRACEVMTMSRERGVVVMSQPHSLDYRERQR